MSAFVRREDLINIIGQLMVSQWDYSLHTKYIFSSVVNGHGQSRIWGGSCGGSDRIFCSPIFFPYYFPVLFQKFEIERFKISVSCFSSTYRYNTVHVPCGISIQTSPVGLPLDGWGAHMRDLKGQKMIFFKQKRIEMFYSTNQSYHWKLNQS